MPTDYKSRVNKKQKKALPGFVWLLSGLAIGLFVAFIVYLDKQPENDQDFGSAVQQELEKLKRQAKQSSSSEPDRSASARTDPGTTEKKEQKFNFYTLLPELEVLIPESETRPPQTSKRATSEANTSYVLQVGSFQNSADAEKLKANLAFLGLEANIQKVTVNKQTWHRVRTGPYHSKQQLYQNKSLLKKHNIDAISMELK